MLINRINYLQINNMDFIIFGLLLMSINLNKKHIMKFSIITFILLFSGTSLFSQDCSELFISEYIEGSSQNKAIEIYNPTSSTIDLSAYSIERYSNGSSTVSESLTLSGSIEPYNVWVVTNGDTDTSGQYGYCFPELYNLGDQAASPYPSPMHFNGNDAIALSKNGTIIDLIGKIGEDPGDGWTDDVTAGFTDANGGTWWTKNHTLVRKSTVLKGVTSSPILFNATSEWDSLSINTWTELGAHTCDCNQNTAILSSPTTSSFIVYPNPVGEGQSFNLSTNFNILDLTLTNLLGQQMSADYKLAHNQATIRTNGLAKGLYVINVLDEKNIAHSTTFIIK